MTDAVAMSAPAHKRSTLNARAAEQAEAQPLVDDDRDDAGHEQVPHRVDDGDAEARDRHLRQVAHA